MNTRRSLVVVGGSDAGVSAALRAREVDPAASVDLLVGDAFPNYSICGAPFYLGGQVSDWRRLAHRTLADIEARGIRVHLNTWATAVDPARHVVEAEAEGRSVTFSYDRLILCTGAEPARPAIPGLDHPAVLALHTMGDMFRLAEVLDRRRPRQALVLGAGYIGLEMAEALTHRGIAVRVVEQWPSVLPSVDAELGDRVAALLRDRGVTVAVGTRVDHLVGRGDGVQVVGTEGLSVEADLVVAATGVRPATRLAADAGVALGERGAIRVDRHMATNLPEVFAAGDCVETYHRLLNRSTYLPLGTTAHKQGRVAGANAAGGEALFAGSLGTQVLKVFDWAVARTGLRDAEAAAAGYDPRTVEWEGPDHKAYYPGAVPLTVRVTGDARTGRLLGAQIFGPEAGSVAKRIDIFAMALASAWRVADLLDADLSYTPPYGSPWDAVQQAAESWLSR